MKAFYSESTRVAVAVYKPRIEIIQKVVSEYFGLTLAETQAHKRKGQSIKARQRIHYLCRELIPGCPMKIIGLVTGNGEAFDHSIICYSYKMIHTEMEFRNRTGEFVYPETREEINRLRSKVVAAFVAAKIEKTKEYCSHCGQELP